MDPKTLHEAIERLDYATISIWLSQGIDVNKKDASGRAPLHVAVESAVNDKIIRQLLLSSEIDVNLVNEAGFTPLHLAAKKNHVVAAELAARLLSKGADINALDGLKNTPLHLAALHGNYSVFRLLLQRGADINFRCSLGRNVLHCLALNSKFTAGVELAGELITRLEGVKDLCCNTPLHLAAKFENSAMVSLLLLSTNVDVRNSIGQTPLHYLARSKSPGSLLVAVEILNFGADVDAADDSGETPLFVAVTLGSLAMVELLLKHGADINRPDNLGFTPVVAAVKSRSLKVLQSLLDHGANVDVQSPRGSPLEVACNFRRLGMVKCLLENGAEPNVLDAEGLSILEKQLLRDPDPRLVKMFLEYGADYKGLLSYEPEESVWKVILEHAALIDPSVELDSSCVSHHAYLQECEMELVKAKSTKLCCNITYYDLLTGDRSELAKFAENKDMQCKLRNSWRIEFPIYGSRMMKKFFKEAYYLWLWNLAGEQIAEVCPVLNPDHLVVVRDVLDYMRIRDLEKLC